MKSWLCPPFRCFSSFITAFHSIWSIKSASSFPMPKMTQAPWLCFLMTAYVRLVIKSWTILAGKWWRILGISSVCIALAIIVSVFNTMLPVMLSKGIGLAKIMTWLHSHLISSFALLNWPRASFFTILDSNATSIQQYRLLVEYFEI